MTGAYKTSPDKQIVGIFCIQTAVRHGIRDRKSSVICKRTERLSKLFFIDRVGKVHINAPCKTSCCIIVYNRVFNIILRKDVVTFYSVTFSFAAYMRYPFQFKICKFFFVFKMMFLIRPIRVNGS